MGDKSFLLIFSVFLIIPALASAAPVGKFTYVSGWVEVMRASAPTIPAKVDEPLYIGDAVRAKSNSKAEITFTNGNIVRVAPNTRIEIKEYMFDEAKSSIVVKLSRGKVQAIVPEKIARLISTFGEANRFEIHTPTAIAGVRGTNFLTFYLKGITGVLVKKGEVYAYNLKFPEAVLLVAQGNITMIPENQPPLLPRPMTDAESNKHESDVAPREESGGDKPKGEETALDVVTTKEDRSVPKTLATLVKITEDISLPKTDIVFFELLRPPTNFTGTINGQFFDDSFSSSSSESINANLTGSIPFYSLSGKVSVPSGIYNNPDQDKIWCGTFKGTTDKGGLFYGYTSGSWTSWEGNFAGFYVENRQIGFLTGSLSGTNDTTLLTGQGTLKNRLVASTAISSLDELSSNIVSDTFSYSDQNEWYLGTEPSIVSFSPSNYKLDVMAIDPAVTGENILGIWREMFSGSSYNNPSVVPRLSSIYGKGDGSYYSLGLSSFADDTENRKLTMHGEYKYLDADVFGMLRINYTGTYDSPGGAYRMAGTGTLESSILLFSGRVAETNEAFAYWDSDVQGSVWEGSIEGLIGGSASLWSGSPMFVALGNYSNPNNGDLWSVEAGGTTLDGGSFSGIMAGIDLDDTLEGRHIGLYIGPNGDTGYIFSNNVVGTLYPGIGKYELGGNLTTLPMGMTNISPSQLNKSIEFFLYDGKVRGDISGYADILSANLVSQDWGIWYTEGSGEYASTPSDTWSASINVNNQESIQRLETKGSQWSDNKLSGTITGYWADLSSTGIYVGETLGTFNPNEYTGGTWQAVSMSVWMDTNKFLEMVADVDGKAKLQQLSIPCVELGRVDLKGSWSNGSDSINMTGEHGMNNVIFFAPYAGARPGIWATNSVNGNYTGDPSGATVKLSGSGLSANFHVRQWDTVNNLWLSRIQSGHGSISEGGPNVKKLNFKGAAAGTINPSDGTFSGTGAGTAK